MTFNINFAEVCMIFILLLYLLFGYQTWYFNKFSLISTVNF